MRHPLRIQIVVNCFSFTDKCVRTVNPIFGLQNAEGIRLGDQFQISQVFGRNENLGASLCLFFRQTYPVGVFVIVTAPYSLFLFVLVPRNYKLFDLTRALYLVFKQSCRHWKGSFKTCNEAASVWFCLSLFRISFSIFILILVQVVYGYIIIVIMLHLHFNVLLGSVLNCRQRQNLVHTYGFSF